MSGFGSESVKKLPATFFSGYVHVFCTLHLMPGFISTPLCWGIALQPQGPASPDRQTLFFPKLQRAHKPQPPRSGGSQLVENQRFLPGWSNWMKHHYRKPSSRRMELPFPQLLGNWSPPEVCLFCTATPLHCRAHPTPGCCRTDPAWITPSTGTEHCPAHKPFPGTALMGSAGSGMFSPQSLRTGPL